MKIALPCFAVSIILSVLAAAGIVGPAVAQTVTTDPPGSGPILAALRWIQGTLLGNVATTAAVVAVAVVGLMMLTGRIDWRRGLIVVMGAFILFGAAAIVEGMRSIATGGP